MSELIRCYPIQKPENRKQTRKVLHELERNIKKFMEVERGYLNSVFDDYGLGPVDCYHWTFGHWAGLTSWMKKNKKFKLTAPNEEYFSSLYAPEKMPELNHGIVFQKFREFADRHTILRA